MVNAFSFPPPPPPPPKASSESSYNQQHTDRGWGHGRGRGRERGENDSRGRGGIRGRSSFHNQQSNRYQSQPASDSNTNQIPYRDQATSTNQHFSASRTPAGHKRKLEALRPSSYGSEKRSALETAPAVPSFVLSATQLQPALSHPIASRAQKVAPRNLGLIPTANDDAPSSESDEEIDEEAMYAELGTKLTFEHDGQVLSLSTPADLEAWTAERKRNWPTRARMSEREAERERIGRERRRLLDEAAKLDRLESRHAASSEGEQRPTKLSGQAPNDSNTGLHADDAKRSSTIDTGHTNSAETSTPKGRVARDAQFQPDAVTLEAAPTSRVQPAQTKEELTRQIEERTANLAMLRRRVEESQAQVNSAKARSSTEKPVDVQKNTTDALNVSDPVEEDSIAARATIPTEDQADKEATIASSDASPDSDSEDDASSDSDAPPEEISSNPNLPLSTSENSRIRPVCRYFVASGYCRDGDVCRFRHELPTRASGAGRPPPSQRHDQYGMQQRVRRDQEHPQVPDVDGSSAARKGLFERLIKQEMEDENKLALQVIKYLGRVGFFAAPAKEAEDS
ncbi:hypothetical protein K431DRAFT_281410 [Polychaeton citri CBS 116435]|uniref:C3H1-type domain-containing protein n=1 Tax=Polychaeton citri CBS 116435 TaxID=1314669 RepID=A0A9P4QHN5_9PEZI|nr:hypothetical protein K431DRAFT_281410 [Polychaeton citri CBS 116435]